MHYKLGYGKLAVKSDVPGTKVVLIPKFIFEQFVFAESVWLCILNVPLLQNAPDEFTNGN